MIKLRLPDPKEPQAPLAFSNKKKCQEHVIKHVFEVGNQRTEAWEEIISTDLIAKAKQEHDQCPQKPSRSDAFVELCEVYRGLGEDIALHNTGTSDGHQHAMEIDLDDDGVIPIEEVIFIWDESQRLFVVLKATVMNGEYLPYRISTVYRKYPHATKEVFERKIRRDLQGFFYPGSKLNPLKHRR